MTHVDADPAITSRDSFVGVLADERLVLAGCHLDASCEVLSGGIAAVLDREPSPRCAHTGVRECAGMSLEPAAARGGHLEPELPAFPLGPE